jgi:hypothetical protein
MIRIDEFEEPQGIQCLGCNQEARYVVFAEFDGELITYQYCGIHLILYLRNFGEERKGQLDPEWLEQAILGNLELE